MADFDKTKPLGSQKLRLSDEEIRANWDALEDAIGRDHKFPTTSAVDAGEHTRVKFTAPIVTPTNAANKGFLYTKDVTAKVELHFLDENNNEVQLTSGGDLLGNPLKLIPMSSPTNGADTAFVYGKDVGGKIELHFLDEIGNVVQITSAGAINVSVPSASIPAGAKIWFYADSAPTGWTLDATPSDEVLAIKGGTTYTTGAATAGGWTHGHTGSGSGSGTSGGPSDVGHNVNGGAEPSPGTGHTHSTTVSVSVTVDANTTFRPKARVGIICSKDA